MSKAQRIFDFIFNWSDAPDNVRRAFEKWLVAHGNEAEVDRAMQKVWETHEVSYDPQTNLKGLIRLHNSIRRQAIPLRRRIGRWVGTAAAMLLLFAGGYGTALRFSPSADQVILLTDEENPSRFTLPDGSQVWLNGGSRLEYLAAFDGSTRDVTLRGEAYFDVRKDPSRPFRVSMNNMHIEVLGTSFNATGYATGRYNEIVLRNGSVRITGIPLRKPVVLRPNERLRYSPADGTVTIELVNAENYCHWFEPRLIFDNTRLADVLVNLERRYRTEIELPASVPAETRLSFIVYREPVEEIMEMLASLLKLRYRVDNGRIIFTAQTPAAGASAPGRR